jgi:hypothetical protein
MKNASSTAAYLSTRKKPYTTANSCDYYEQKSANENQNTSSFDYVPSIKRKRKPVNRNIQENTENTVSSKNWWAAFFLCLFLGTLGIHRFYAGRIVSGILMLLTFGGAGIWILIDLVLLITKNFADGEGNYILR